LFTAGTSVQKEKVGGKRGLTLRFAQRDNSRGEMKDVPIILQAQIENK